MHSADEIIELLQYRERMWRAALDRRNENEMHTTDQMYSRVMELQYVLGLIERGEASQSEVAGLKKVNTTLLDTLRRAYEAFVADQYRQNECDCDPSVGITNCLVCEIRGLIE